LMRQLQNNISGTISRIGDWGKKIKIIKTETSLHFNLEVFYFLILFIFYLFIFHFIFYFILFFIYTYIFSFIYLFFIFILIFILFIFYFQSSLCISNTFQLTVDCYTVSPCLYLWNLFCLFLCFDFWFFSTWLFVFLFSFNFFAFHPLSPFHSEYH
jgi:hypothetical protein